MRRQRTDRRYYARCEESRTQGVLAQSVERIGQQRRRHRTDTGNLMRLQQSRFVRHQKQLLVAEPGEVVQAMRRHDDRRPTIALRLERGVQPA